MPSEQAQAVAIACSRESFGVTLGDGERFTFVKQSVDIVNEDEPANIRLRNGTSRDAGRHYYRRP